MKRPLYTKIVQLFNLMNGILSYAETHIIYSAIKEHYRLYGKKFGIDTTSDFTYLDSWITAHANDEEDIHLSDYHLKACNQLYKHLTNIERRGKSR